MGTALTGLALAFSVADGPSATEREMEKLAGSWIIVTAEAAGKPLELAKGSMLIFRGAKLKLRGKIARSAGGEDDAIYHLDPSKKPKTFDLTPLKPPGGKEPVLRGIYDLNGDELKLCFGKSGSPAEFRSDDALLLILKREKN